MRSLLLTIYKGRHILKTMVIKDIKGRYAGSVFGMLWIAVAPLYQIFLYTLLFSVILKVRFGEEAGSANFVVYLLAGLIPWIFFAEALQRGISSFIENGHLIKKINFPIELCPLSVLVSSMVNFLIFMFFYALMLTSMGLIKIHSLVYVFLPFAIQCMLIFGLSVGIGSIAVFFRDVIQAIGMFLNFIFFMTPIVYPATAIPEGFRWFFLVNPFYWLVQDYRTILIKGEMPGMESFAYPLALSIFVFFAGLFIFNKTKEAFKDIL